jgi:hypothetical protein
MRQGKRKSASDEVASHETANLLANAALNNCRELFLLDWAAQVHDGGSSFADALLQCPPKNRATVFASHWIRWKESLSAIVQRHFGRTFQTACGNPDWALPDPASWAQGYMQTIIREAFTIPFKGKHVVDGVVGLVCQFGTKRKPMDTLPVWADVYRVIEKGGTREDILPELRKRFEVDLFSYLWATSAGAAQALATQGWQPRPITLEDLAELPFRDPRTRAMVRQFARKLKAEIAKARTAFKLGRVSSGADIVQQRQQYPELSKVGEDVVNETVFKNMTTTERDATKEILAKTTKLSPETINEYMKP